MRGRLKLQLFAPTVNGRSRQLIAERRATNSVMQSGAMLVAQLFAGTGSPITHMGVGTNDAAPADTTTTALVNEPDGDLPALVGDTTTAIAAELFSFEVDDVRRVIRTRTRATLAADAAVGRIREAGLLARPPGGGDDVLYNRVIFDPIDKGNDHELTLFWDVEFPFGDLQWLT